MGNRPVCPLLNPALHYEYLRDRLSKRGVKFEKKLPVFHDVKDELEDNIIRLWVKSGLPILTKSRVQSKRCDRKMEVRNEKNKKE